LTQHKNNIIKKKTDSFLVKHFNKPGHGIDKLRIRVIDSIDHDNRLEKNVRMMKLRTLEAMWIRELNAAYPLGLNDQVMNYGNIGDFAYVSPETKNNQPYFTAKKKIHKKRGKQKTKKKPSVDPDFIHTLNTLLRDHRNRDLYLFLRKSNKITLEHAVLQTKSIDIPVELKLIITGYYAGFYGYKSKNNDVNDEKRNVDRICIPYCSKDLDDVYLQRLLNSTKIQEKLTANDNQRRKIQIIYTHKPPLTAFLCNHKSFIKKHSLQELHALANSQCRCQSTYSKYSNPNLGHVITADTDVVRSICRETADLLDLGTKYITNQNNITEENYEDIKTTIIATMDKICTRNEIPNKHRAIKRAMAILDRVIRKKTRIISANTIQRKPTTRHLHNFIISPVDKAGNNFGISCSVFYANQLLQEMGFLQSAIPSTNNTYELTTLDEQTLQSKHEVYNNKYGVKAEPNTQIPVLYGIPKLHKKPPKYRYIAGASNATTKELSILLHRILVHFKDHFKNYCKVIESRTNKKMYISIPNSQQFQNHMQFYGKKLDNATTYDFSTLYTKLPHGIVLQNMFQLVDKLFSIKGQTHVGLDLHRKESKPFYCSSVKNTNKYTYYSKEDIKALIEFIIHESYVNVGKKIFRQTAGIPQGGNASPDIADLTLSWLEFKYFNSRDNVINKNALLYRYIDDILCINLDFDTISPCIYPSSLTLNKDSGSNGVVNYLDVSIYTRENKCTVYNKLDVFEFHVHRAYHANSCVPSRMIAGTIVGQLYRFTGITSKFDDWIHTTVAYVKQLKEKKHASTIILGAIAKFCGKYPHMLYKYNIFTRKDVTDNILTKVATYC
jgi:hypothetical protein